MTQGLRKWVLFFFCFQNVPFSCIGAPGWPLGDRAYLNWPQLATLQTYSNIKYIYMVCQEKNLSAAKPRQSPFQGLCLWEIALFKQFFRVFLIFWPKKRFFQIRKKMKWKIWLFFYHIKKELNQKYSYKYFYWFFESWSYQLEFFWKKWLVSEICLKKGPKIHFRHPKIMSSLFMVIKMPKKNLKH